MQTFTLFALLASELGSAAALAEPSGTQSIPPAAPVTAPHNHMTEKSDVPALAKHGSTAPDKAGMQKRHIHSRDAK
ncbi:MAG: hypothetical protein JWL63_2386 [Rhodocyclales bacterium]|nr:hypothetical protein [Rhodocyclales bacterium]